MTEKNKRLPGKEELPLEKRAMEVILKIIVAATLIYFFLLIVVL